MENLNIFLQQRGLPVGGKHSTLARALIAYEQKTSALECAENISKKLDND